MAFSNELIHLKNIHREIDFSKSEHLDESFIKVC